MILINVVTALVTFAMIEVLAHNVFKIVKQKFEFDNSNSHYSTIKGIIERFVVFVGLLLNFAPILILFGALKIATRFKEEDEKISNDYFLIGNFLSILFVFITYMLNNFFIMLYFQMM